MARGGGKRAASLGRVLSAASLMASAVAQQGKGPAVEWRAFEQKFREAAAGEEELADLFDLSDYDVSVQELDRKILEKNKKLAQQVSGSGESLDCFTQLCLQFFTKPYLVVQGSSFDKSLDGSASSTTRRAINTVKVSTELASSTGGSSTAKDSSNKKKDAIPAVAPRNTPVTIDTTELHRDTQQDIDELKLIAERNIAEDLFQAKEYAHELGSHSGAHLQQVEGESLAPFGHKAAKQLRVDFLDLKFASGIQEPLFIVASVVDVRERRRLTESFCLNLNTQELNDLWQVNPVPAMAAKSCLVPLHAAVPDAYLVIRVQRILRPDLDKDTVLYSKRSLKKSQCEKVLREATAALETFGLHMQPLAWAAVKLADDVGKLRDGPMVIEELHPARNGCSDEAIFDHLSRETDGKQSKNKPIPAQLTISFADQGSQDVPGVLDPSLNAVTWEKGMEVVREVEWFGSKMAPHSIYVNNLYIYPQTVTLRHNHPNIQVMVELRDNDATPARGGLPIVYAGWDSLSMTSAGRSAVHYKEKRPAFFDEIKIQLPTVLTNKHHLLFTFRNVGLDAQVETLAYAMLPIYNPTSGIIHNESHSIPLFAELVPNYMSQAESRKYLEIGKFMFTFDTKLLSSIYSADKRLVDFAKLVPFGPQGQTREAQLSEAPTKVLTNLLALPPATCMEFFPILLDGLFSVACIGKNETLSKNAIACVGHILGSVKEYAQGKSRAQNHMLVGYARYFFSVPHGRFYPHEVLAHYWLQLLEEKSPHLTNLSQTAVLLSILLKSMICRLCEEGSPAPDARLTSFSEEFLSDLRRLVKELFCSGAIAEMQTLTLVPTFMKDLLGILHRGVVFEMIYEYLTYLTDLNTNHAEVDNLFLATVKFTFIKIVTANRHYVPLNVPTPIEFTGDAQAMVTNFWTEHFFAGLLMREVRSGLLEKKGIREQSISIIRQLIHSHNIDPRYKDRARRERVTGLYFPFVLIAIEFRQVLVDYLAPEEKQNWLLCFFYIVKNCNRDLLTSWWTNESQARRVDFFAMMEMSIEVFAEDRLYPSVCFIVVDQLLDFVVLFAEQLRQPHNAVVAKLFSVIEKLQRVNTKDFIQAVFNLLKVIVNVLHEAMFSQEEAATYCSIVTLEIIRHCNSESRWIRGKACSMLLYLFEKNYEATGDLARTEEQTVISLSRLAAEVPQTQHLRESLELLLLHSQQNTGLRLPAELLTAAVERIFTIVRFTEQLDSNRENAEYTADLYLNIANKFTAQPSLRVTWLSTLSSHQSKARAWAEASLTKVRIAYLVAQHLDRRGCPFNLKAFSLVDPNLGPRDLLPARGEGGAEEAFAWDLETFTKVIHEALLLMKQAKQYELCTELYCLLLEAYKQGKNYSKLMDCLTEFRLQTEVLVATNKDLRILAMYFRVAFFGERFGVEDGKAYIYRCGPKENLMTMQQRLKAALARNYQVTDADIEVLGNQEVERSSLEAGKLYLQMASVSPYFDSGEGLELSAFEKNFGCSTFLFESSFATGQGKEQSKKKTIYYTAEKFPNVVSRLEVIKSEEIFLTPLESSIDLIKDRIERFEEVLNVSSKDVRMNQLQQLLQGSVVPMVNEGPLKICESYLAAELRSQYPKDQTDLLEDLMKKFIKLCGFGIKLANQVIFARQMTEHEQFMQMLEKHYAILKEKVATYIPDF